MTAKNTRSKSILSVQNIILASIFWALLALFIFLLGSPITPRPSWYGDATYILENTPFFVATLLCFRNWKSSKIVSGRTVWLMIGLGTLCYFLGNVILGRWENTFGYAPDVSPADFLYLLSYLFLGIGMLLAVVSKQLNLSFTQWAIVSSIVLIGILIAYLVSGYAGGEDIDANGSKDKSFVLNSPSFVLSDSSIGSIFIDDSFIGLVFDGWVAQASQPDHENTPTLLAEVSVPSEPEVVSPEAIDVQSDPGNNGSIESIEPSDLSEVSEEANSDIPSWMLSINDQLEPFADVVWILYLAGDTFLVVMATMLLLAFWGGRFSLSWRCIAAAGLSLYIADIWYYYALDNIENYETGALPEVFWIFSGVLLCIGAALEYSLSTRSRRGRRRSV